MVLAEAIPAVVPAVLVWVALAAWLALIRKILSMLACIQAYQSM
jgi:hypothetical protein